MYGLGISLWNASSPSATPIVMRNDRARILKDGLAKTNSPIGPAANSSTTKLAITAEAITTRSFVIPTAVTTESRAKTTSTATIVRTVASRARRGSPASTGPSSLSSTVW